MRILVVGSGGREHAIAWSLDKSPTPTELFFAPGNTGTAVLGKNIPVSADDIAGLLEVARARDIDLVIVGPEVPLVLGLADRLRDAKIPVVGPSAEAARLEGSKAFSKAFMERNGIPTASFRTFHRRAIDDAIAYVESEGAPIVIKASGLAAGKGAIVCMTEPEARRAVRTILGEGALGEAGEEVVIEAYMEGEEASVFALTDGRDYVLLASAQDHKRIGEGDTGLNTGGMGAYAPAPLMTKELTNRVCAEIIEPTLSGMASEGYPYSGILYVGLMVDDRGPRVVEYNCRLGDPETQVVLPLLISDSVELFSSLAAGTLADYDVVLSNGAAACVVIASAGYPGSYEKGKRIDGMDAAALPDETVVFHAGISKEEDGSYFTSGGRVLAVTARGDDLSEALESAYEGVDEISFEGSYFRRDIGQKGLARLKQMTES